MHTNRFLYPLAVLAVLMFGCDGGTSPQSAHTTKQAQGNEISVTINPCELLSAEQVAGVLHNAPAGVTTNSGSSLVRGVDAYQCSYFSSVGDLLIVILNVAADDAHFANIKPGSAVREHRQRVEAGDEGWMSSTPGEVKIKAAQGRTVIDIELTASDAADKSTQLVALAQAVAAKIK